MKGLVISLLSLAHFALGAKQYYAYDTMANWHAARDYCTSQGMQLATVESWQDHYDLTEVIQKLDKFTSDQTTRFWLGANDLDREGHFTWINSGKPVCFTRWAPGEPNNVFWGEDCVEIIYSVPDNRIWVWNDIDCRNKAYFVCESVPGQCDSVQRQYESVQKKYKDLQKKYQCLQNQYEAAQRWTRIIPIC